MDTTRNKTRPEILSATERRRKIFELRKAGATYRSITQALINEYGADALPKGYGPREAARDVARELGRLHRETALDVLEVTQMELARLDSLLLTLWPHATGGDLQAVDRVLRIMQRQAVLQGIVPPVTIDWRIEVIALLQAGTITPAMVEDELGSDLAAELFERAGIRVKRRRLGWVDDEDLQR